MNTKQIDIESGDAATSVSSALFGKHKCIVFQALRRANLMKRLGSKTKQTTLVAVFFIRLARSHANMFANNKFSLVYECGIFEASVPAAVFVR